jgi:Outer membrane lipoprotein-sorting protein
MIRPLFASLLLAALPVWADPTAPGDPAAGQALAEQIRNSLPEENSQLQGTLIIRAGGQTVSVPIVCRLVLHDGFWESDYDTGATNNIAAEKLIVIHRTNAPVEYLYARAPSPSAALPKPASLSPAEAAVTALAGSDFSAADLGLDFLHWPQQRQFKSEMHLGQMCYVLESRDPGAKSIVRVTSYVDKESNGLLIADAYDATEHLVKHFSLGNGSFKKVHGRYHLEKMDIQDKKKHSRTELKFDIKDP